MAVVDTHGGSTQLEPDVVVGVDLGGTKISAALVDRRGMHQRLSTCPSRARSGPEQVLDTVADLVSEVLDRDRRYRLRAVGVGTAGVVDARRGTIVSSTDAFLGWAGTAVAEGLRRRLGVPVVVRNDVDAHAAGEAWLGAAAGVASALMVAVGTGVGAGVVLDGRVLAGAHHVAGEMGHMPAPGAQGMRCACGRTGHLEAVASGPGLHRWYLARGGSPSCPDARAVLARAVAGEELAQDVVRDSARTLGRSIAGVVTVLDPEMVVLGGGLARAGELWWSALVQALRAEVIEPLAGLEIQPATHGMAAPVVGAAWLAWQGLDQEAASVRRERYTGR